MPSLWTPEGEHRVPRDTPPSPPPGAAHPETGAAAGIADAHAGHDHSAEEAAAIAEMAELQAELLAAPVGEVIANHCYGLFQLAALHLSQQPPNLEESRLAIDALACLVEGLAERIGGAYSSLTDGLAQLRLAYVQLSGIVGAVDPTEGPAR